MTTLLEAILLGFIQGLTEWLPISSSGHLVIAQQLLKIEVPLLFDVMLHIGSLFAVFVLFWKDILKIIKSFLKLDFKSQEGKLGLFIIIGSIPVGFAGFLLHDYIEYFFNNLFLVSVSLIVTGILLYFTKNKNGRNKLNFSDSVLIGFTQAIALVPGISRSGSTISMGLLRNIEKKIVFEFSFLLSIPAIIGANFFEIIKFGIGDNALLAPMFIGTVIAGIIGYVSLKFLFKTIQKEKFYLFSYYCWVVGIILIAYVFRVF